MWYLMLGRVCGSEPCTTFVGFLVEMTVFWKYLASDMIKKTWIITHEVFEIFGWTFFDGFDVLKLYLCRLPTKAAKVSVLHF